MTAPHVHPPACATHHFISSSIYSLQTIRKIALYLRNMLEKHVASELASDKTLNKMEKKAAGMESLKVRAIHT